MLVITPYSTPPPFSVVGGGFSEYLAPHGYRNGGMIISGPFISVFGGDTLEVLHSQHPERMIPIGLLTDSVQETPAREVGVRSPRFCGAHRMDGDRTWTHRSVLTRMLHG
jgi:hypothetical protein